MKNKKGIGYTEIIFIFLNLMVFSCLLIFINSASNNSSIYEQTYAKQIALMIDSASPNMTISLDISEAVKYAEKNKKDIVEAFRINSNTKEVFVNLDKKGGYSFYYLSNYNIGLQIDGNRLNIVIK